VPEGGLLLRTDEAFPREAGDAIDSNQDAR
jgi:hypothetical protein